MIVGMSISNGCIVVITSTINIICVNQGVESIIASICVFIGTITGLLWSIIYGEIFKKRKDHSLTMSLNMLISGIFIFLFSLSLYLEHTIFFCIFFVLFSTFSLIIIPFFMEKTSFDFENISFNVINLGKYKLL